MKIHMKEQFIPYDLAVKLKELGFDEKCFITYYDNKSFTSFGQRTMFIKNSETKKVCAPLWQQAFDWFREKHNLFIKIDFFQSDEFEELDYDYSIFNLKKPFKDDGITDNPLIDYSVNETYYFKYQEARQACLKKLIELCQIQNL